MNILIVEDDRLVRNWLSIMLRQLDIPQLALYEAGNGLEALALCQKQPMDLVFTDLKMPRMNGMELITHLKESWPQTQIAVLSAYDDFQYVRTALKHGALDYILKPELKIEDLQSILARCRSLCDQKEAGGGALKDLYNCYNCATLNPLFNKCLLGKAPEREFLIEFLGPRREGPLSLSFFALKDGPATENQAFPIMTLCADILESCGLFGYCFYTEDGFFALCFYCREPVQVGEPELQQQVLSRIYYGLVSQFDQALAYSVEGSVAGQADFFKKARELHECIYARRYYDRACPLDSLVPIGESELQSLTSRLRQLSEFREYTQALSTLLAFLSNAHERSARPADLKRALVHGFRALVILSGDAGGTALSERLSGFAAQALSASTQAETEKAAEAFSLFYLSCFSQDPPGLGPAVRKAKAYIDKNYMQHITLKDAAAQVHLDKSYLSLIFKKQTGTPLSDYLENVRICHAKRLLRETEKSVTDIAEAVGFSSQNYFSKVFKTAVGVSPLHYRNSRQNAEPETE